MTSFRSIDRWESMSLVAFVELDRRQHCFLRGRQLSTRPGLESDNSLFLKPLDNIYKNVMRQFSCLALIKAKNVIRDSEFRKKER